MTKGKKILFIAAGVIFVTLAVLFFFYDLEISKLLVQDKPYFIFTLLAAIGEFPIYIGPVLFGLVYGFIIENKCLKISSFLVGLIGVYVASIRLSQGIYENFFNSELGLLKYSLLAVASLFIYVLLYMVFNKMSLEKIGKLKDLALLSFVVSISSFAMITIIKHIWGRPRYYQIKDDLTQFSNYLTIHGFNNSRMGNGYLSFPSGHTNSASCIMILPFIFNRITNKKWVNIVSTIISYSYIALVGVSRICLGAHFASDVLFGFGINCVCFTITYIILKKKGWLHVRSNKC